MANSDDDRGTDARDFVQKRRNAKDFGRNAKYFDQETAKCKRKFLHSRRVDTKSLGLCALELILSSWHVPSRPSVARSEFQGVKAA
jgi:hypothetical protein